MNEEIDLLHRLNQLIEQDLVSIVYFEDALKRLREMSVDNENKRRIVNETIISTERVIEGTREMVQKMMERRKEAEEGILNNITHE